MAETIDEGTKSTVKKLPLMTINAGPRDKEAWEGRLKQELQALIRYIQVNKESDTDW
jgi:ufm1-conjugating enzyme 1